MQALNRSGFQSKNGISQNKKNLQRGQSYTNKKAKEEKFFHQDESVSDESIFHFDDEEIDISETKGNV